MSSTGSFRVVFCALMLLLPFLGHAAPSLSISPYGYRIVQATPVAGTSNQFELVARAGIANSGEAAQGVSARLTSSTPTVTVLDGSVTFGTVGAVTLQRPIISADTFKLRVTTPRKPTLQNILQFAQTALNSLAWTIECSGCSLNRAPLADAGPNKSSYVATPTVLSGAGSSDPDGNALTYRWSLVSRPHGSVAALSDANAVDVTLTPDIEGDFIVQLIVNDGALDSSPSTVTVTTVNSLPVAVAGPDHAAHVGERVVLDGSNSTDVDGDSLTYTWRLIARPSSSTAALLNVDPAHPMADFIVDRPGNYIAELIVNDGATDSSPDTVSISTENSTPIADAGADQTVQRGSTARLSGVESRDADGDVLTYRWSLSPPAGSGAVLVSANAMDTAFVVDRPGSYIVQLIVRDGTVDSVADTAVISTANSAPTANAGANVSALVGDTVTLDGQSSQDPDNDPLSFTWALISRPIDSRAALTAPDTPRPGFIADVAGLYVAQLIVNDGRVDSAPDTAQVVVEVMPDTFPPTISIGTPNDGALVNTPSVTIAGQLSEPAQLLIGGMDVELNAVYQFSATVALTEGPNAVLLLAVDAAGNATSRAITVILDSVAPSAPDVARIHVDNTGAVRKVIGDAESVEAGATVRIINARTGEVVIVQADAAGAFETEVAGEAGDELTMQVIDGAQNRSEVRRLAMPPSLSLTLNLNQPQAGALVTSRYLVVSGSVEGSSEAGVVVNNVIASTRSAGANTAFITRIRLESGVNSIIIAASTLDGKRIERTVQVTRENVPPVEVVANVMSGVAPLTVEFDIASYTESLVVVQSSYDFDGDGQTDQAIIFPGEPTKHTFNAAGIYLVRVQLLNDVQETTEFVIPVSVIGLPELDTKLRAVWNRFTDALSGSDVLNATSLVALSAREKYSGILSDLSERLPHISESISMLTPVSVGARYSEYAISKLINGERQVFCVSFIQDADGVWRIVGM
jgi:PKD repeat protein